MNLAANPSVAHAFNRFGFGGRPDDVAPADPMAWLAAQITCADQAPGGPSLAQGLSLAHNVISAPDGSSAHGLANAQLVNEFSAEVQSILAYAVTTPIPFRERLVWFWANHFAIMAQNDRVTAATAGAYTRDAIRANMTGTIAQMLQAAILHPAMLHSLNAPASIGPQSPLGLRLAKRGVSQNINENLGRETLELYTLGYDEGYAQADVDAMAYLLSGMDVNLKLGAPLGAFYNLDKQQPGSFTLMGSVFPGTMPGLMSALQMLGTHPNTYRHLATKLVTHFVSDTPSQADIATVARAFATSGGSLAAAHLALIGLQNAWLPLQKFRTPLDFVIAILRTAGATAANMPPWIDGWVTSMGQPVWCPPFPNGWSDLAGDWTGPGPLLLRSDWTAQYAHYLVGSTPAQAAAVSVAPFLGDATQAGLASALLRSSAEQFTLLFCSSEFQRR
jgi:uncharacterized protein (DUF1800 family)